MSWIPTSPRGLRAVRHALGVLAVLDATLAAGALALGQPSGAIPAALALILAFETRALARAERIRP